MRKKSVALVFVTLVVILLLVNLVSAFSLINFFDNFFKKIKDLFSVGEKEKGLEGELRSLEPTSSPNYSSSDYCADTCETFGYKCGNYIICVQEVNCGNCSEGYNCINGTCILNQTNITCYTDADCPPVYGEKYCNNKSESCQPVTFYKCENNGTINSKCVATAGAVSCKVCEYGCSNGTCIDSNPVAYYKFENNTQDSSRNNYHGNPIGNVNYITGVSGQSTNYDGSGDGVSMGNVLNFGTNDFTASFWFNPTWTKNERIFMKRGGLCGCAGGGFWEFGIDTAKKIWFYVYDGPSCGPNSVNLPSASTYNSNTWYHVVGVRQGNKTSLYVNGILQGSKQTVGIANVDNTGNLMLGDSKCSNADFSGKFDEVKIWNRALSASEILAEYNSIIPPNQTCTAGWKCKDSMNKAYQYSDCTWGNSTYCQYGCINGACINQTNITCYTDADCPLNYGEKYCNNKSESCQPVTFYKCENPGTINSKCVATAGAVSCKVCEYGCANGLCNPASSILVSYWKFDGNAIDYIGNKSGSVYGAVLTKGVSGQAYKFDGYDDYINLGYILNNEIRNAFTIGVWVKLDSEALNKSLNYVFHKYDDRPGIRIGSDRKVSFSKWYAYTGCCLSSNVSVQENKWHYLAYTFDGTTFRGYIDGQLVTSGLDSVGTKYSPGSSVSVGRDEKDPSYQRYFKGIIDEVKVWNYALNSSQILGEYNSIPQFNCTDSDGGLNYYVKGTTYGPYVNNTDYCNGNILQENYCLNNNQVMTAYTCPNGCENGACIINATISLATLRDNYKIGEQINLTDPPENNPKNKIISFIKDIIKKVIIGKVVDENDETNNFERERYENVLDHQDEIIIQQEVIEDQIEQLPDHAPGEIIIKFKEDPRIKERGFFSQLILRKPKIETKFPSINRIHKKFKIEKSEKIFDGRIEKKIKQFENIRKLKLKDEKLKEAIEEYKKDENVEYAEPNYLAYTSFVPNDALYSQQWAHQNTQAELGWDIERGNSNVVIAIIDTGVDYNHEDLQENIYFWMYDFVEIDTQAYQNEGLELIEGEDYLDEDSDPIDFNGHGTHVAGIAAGRGNNGIGISGICPNCKIMAIRAGFSIKHPYYGEVGSLEYDDIAQAIINATDSGADIISMSFGGPSDELQVKPAIKYAYNKNVTLIAAAGNSNKDMKSYPAGYDEVISVAATAQDDSKAYYSNYGYWVDVAAPGGDNYKDSMILSTVPKTGGILSDSSGYKFLQGTSMAAPYVAGLAGLILSKNSGLSQEDVRDILRQGVDNPNSDKYIGTGRVNVDKALQIDFVPSEKVEIVSPKNGDFVMVDTDIVGTALGDRYVVEYGFGAYPNEWIEIGNGNQVQNGVLAHLIIENISEGYYNLRLTVYDQNLIFEDRVYVSIGKGYQKGWPLQTADGLSMFFPPIVDDLEGNGEQQIIIGGGFRRGDYFPYGALHVFNYNGTYFRDFPLIAGYDNFIGIPEQPGSIGDINNDGKKEIVISTSRWPTDTNKDIGGLYVFDLDKNLLWSKHFDNGDERYYRCNSLADINNDNKLEIMLQTLPSKKIRALDYSGNELWSKELNGEMGSINLPGGCFSIGDLNGDYSQEIMFFAYDTESVKGLGILELYVLNPQGDELFSYSWTVNSSTDYLYVSNYILGDINKDKKPELFFAITNFPQYYGTLYSLDFNSSYNIKSIRKLDISENHLGMGDVNNDDNIEIIVTGAYWGQSSCGCAHSRKIQGVDINGNLIFDRRIDSCGIGSPTIADVNGDYYSDIVFYAVCKDNNSLYAIDRNGQDITGFPKKMYGFTNYFNPAIGDLDNDGDVEIVIHDFDSRIYIWDILAPYDPSTMEWPMFQHDAQHTGCYGCEKQIIKPQSKIVNNMNINLTGNLTMILQKNISGIWQDVKIVVNKQVTIPANSLLKLDSEWNSQNVVASESGSYRVYAKFEVDGQFVEASWEFVVI